MAKQLAQEPERWRDIPGFGGIYQASTYGRIRKTWPISGKRTIMQTYVRTRRQKGANRKTHMVHLTKPDGSRLERPVLQLVAATWFGIPEGMYVVHRNGLHADNSIDNVLFVTRTRLGTKYGGQSSRRPVVMVDREGMIVRRYPSARAAGRDNYLSGQTVMDRCNGKVKNEFALTGYTYRWDDD